MRHLYKGFRPKRPQIRNHSVQLLGFQRRSSAYRESIRVAVQDCICTAAKPCPADAGLAAVLRFRARRLPV